MLALLVKWQLKRVCQTGIYWVYLVKPTNCNILPQEHQPQMDMVDEQGWTKIRQNSIKKIYFCLVTTVKSPSWRSDSCLLMLAMSSFSSRPKKSLWIQLETFSFSWYWWLQCSGLHARIFHYEVIRFCRLSVTFVGGLEAQLPTEMEEINVLEDLHLDHMTLWVSAHC